jgi:putative ribosome biogenesis GTPase RsgA
MPRGMNSSPRTSPRGSCRRALRWRINISTGLDGDAELSAQVTGKFIHESRRDHSVLPKVGDWVAVKLVPNEEKATIHAILPRRTQITRKTTGRETSAQILATNIETVFLVTAADASFNPRDWSGCS